MNCNNPASFWQRLGASLLDTVVLVITVSILSAILFSNSAASNFSENILKFGYALLLPLFWYGYTLGKRMLGIRIVKLDGSNIGFLASFLRTIGSFIYIIPMYLSFYYTFGLDFSNYQNQIINMVTTGNPSPYPIIIGFLSSITLYIISIFMVALRSDHRSIHDFIAGTYVTKNKPTK